MGLVLVTLQKKFKKQLRFGREIISLLENFSGGVSSPDFFVAYILLPRSLNKSFFLGNYKISVTTATFLSIFVIVKSWNLYKIFNK